ncbi:MAG TPA: AAA family ATPase [Nocardioides sp.]|uniref:AAA family ATPase n=1 Tax=Nocardioides sp. TaxID=35761 RepID=UPI002F41BDAA
MSRDHPGSAARADAGNEIVGRAGELTTIQGFLDATGAVEMGLLIEGEAGTGKSTLWEAGLAYAQGHSFHMLRARPAEAESGMPHSGLTDLFEGAVLDEVLAEISPPRRRALEVTMLRAEPEQGPVDDRALALAVRDVVQLLGRDHRVLLAIDDVQWLDPASSGTLAFALRRLPGDHLHVLLARRTEAGMSVSELEAVLRGRFARLALGPLSVEALHQLLLHRFGTPYGRQTMLRIHQQSRGNPLFALELARVLQADTDPFGPAPVPASLERLVRTRLSALPGPTRDLLALASALGSISDGLVRRAGFDAETLQPAVAAQVVERRDGDVRFTHPLFSTVVYEALGGERRAVHARLATLIEDPLLRARRIPCCAPAISPCRRTSRAGHLLTSWTRPSGSPSREALQPSQPSSPSRRSA